MRLGPGAYEPKIVRDDTCLVSYKRSETKTIPRVNVDRMDREIGPGHYNSKDDLVKPKILGFKIVLPKVNPLEEFENIDRRLPLELNYNQVDGRIPGGQINPVPNSENPLKFLDLLEEAKMGPGFYDPDPNKVLPRTDILGAKMAPLNSNNDRAVAMDLANKDVADPVLNINYSQVEKRPQTTLIKGPVDRKEPPNTPENVLYPERWEFYDPNMAAVRPNTAVGGVFAAEDFLSFKLKENEREMLREYLQMQHRVPDPGYYDPIFKLLESGVAIPDFDRYLERSRVMTRSEIMQRDMEGDVLVLDPQPRPIKFCLTRFYDFLVDVFSSTGAGQGRSPCRL